MKGDARNKSVPSTSSLISRCAFGVIRARDNQVGIIETRLDILECSMGARGTQTNMSDNTNLTHKSKGMGRAFNLLTC